MKSSLVIDIGNTKTKVVDFEEGNLQRVQVFDKAEQLSLSQLNPEQIPVIVSAVGNKEERLIEDQKENVLIFERDLKLPVSLSYDTPHTLGLDRIANASAVADGKGNHLIIDIGTCVTFDLVDRSNVYQGGLIYPGIDMRFKSMNYYTDKLPYLDWRSLWNDSKEFKGKSTSSSMMNGVKQGMLMELHGLVHQYQQEHDDLQVHLTGGDAVFFEKELKNGIFAQPYLGCQGLNKILALNI